MFEWLAQNIGYVYAGALIIFIIILAFILPNCRQSDQAVDLPVDDEELVGCTCSEGRYSPSSNWHEPDCPANESERR